MSTNDKKITLSDYKQIPNLTPLLRAVNIVLVLIAIYLMTYLNYVAFLFGVVSRTGLLPLVLCLTLTAGLISGFLTIAGNGHRVYILCVISSFLSLAVALVLLNTFYILGFDTTFDLMNGFHFWAAIIIVLLLVSSYLTLLAAVQIKNRNEWLKKNVCVWPNDKPPHLTGHTGVNAQPQPFPVPGAGQLVGPVEHKNPNLHLTVQYQGVPPVAPQSASGGGQPTQN